MPEPHHQTGTITHPTPQKSVFTTPNPFEKRFGYHRAVRKGPFIFVSGTTALIETPTSTSTSAEDRQGESKDGKGSQVHYPTDARKQAGVAMSRCVDAVQRLGGQLGDVVRVRMFVSRHEDCLDVGEAFRDCFVDSDEPGRGATAAATMVVVKDGFVDPDILVEVEVDAVLDS